MEVIYEKNRNYRGYGGRGCKVKRYDAGCKYYKSCLHGFCEGNIDGSPIVVVRSGIGKVNAGLCTQILIDRYGVDLVINTGIAGSLRNEIDIADIVISTDALQHDVDASGFGYDLGVIPRMENSILRRMRNWLA